jgi:hypothetical protein
LRYPRGVLRTVALLSLLAGCQTSTSQPPAPRSTITADECPRFLAKARATITELGAHAGVPYTHEIEQTAERDCRADVAAGKPMALGRCVLDATDEAAVHACFPTYDQLVNRKPAP